MQKGASPIVTDMSYQSDSIYISISAQRVNASDVYVADIYVKDIAQFTRSFASQKFGKAHRPIRSIASEQDAILSLTGDNSHLLSKGFVLANGSIIRNSSNRKRDLCVLYKDGRMETLLPTEIDYQKLQDEKDKIWQTFLFGPMLLQNGQPMTKFNSSVSVQNPRAVIGYYEPLHYCFIVVDGRGTKSALENAKNKGMTMSELSKFAFSLGLQSAYNLDGGQSAQLHFNGRTISTPYKGGRYIGDAVTIIELEE